MSVIIVIVVVIVIVIVFVNSKFRSATQKLSTGRQVNHERWVESDGLSIDIELPEGQMEGGRVAAKTGFVQEERYRK